MLRHRQNDQFILLNLLASVIGFTCMVQVFIRPCMRVFYSHF
uniref:Uncharacterized protein n=1 Tax=Arundo donax TaxID=35708 RepID=A0A0A8Y8W0_ARUDO